MRARQAEQRKDSDDLAALPRRNQTEQHDSHASHGVFRRFFQIPFTACNRAYAVPLHANRSFTNRASSHHHFIAAVVFVAACDLERWGPMRRQRILLISAMAVSLPVGPGVYQHIVEGRTTGGYTLGHSASTFFFDVQGRVRFYGRFGAGAPALASDIKTLLAGA